MVGHKGRERNFLILISLTRNQPHEAGTEGNVYRQRKLLGGSNLPGVFVETNTYPKSSRKEEENDEIPEYQESRA